jgi:F-type H+-transporting ATPase subunit delta
MKNTRVARRYATALMSLAAEMNAVERISSDMEGIGATVQGSRELRRFLASPVVSRSRKKVVMKDLFGGSVAALVQAFVNLLIDKQREVHLPGIIDEFALLRDERLGIVGAEVTSAVDLTPAQGENMRKQLEQYTRKSVRLRLTQDAGIRGGIIVRIGDTVLDASVRHQLDRLRERFVVGGTPTK